jgi:uncharacterized membrane protein
MQLSPEDRQKIYEEEKARKESEQKPHGSGTSSTGLDSNVAGLLCYVGAWISGIVFIILERNDWFVRFHALQSIITFGALSVFGAILGVIPFIGDFLSGVVGIVGFILWIVLMIKAYQGEMYRVPVAGDIAASALPPDYKYHKAENTQKSGPPAEEKASEKPAASGDSLSSEISDMADRLGEKADELGKKAEEFGRKIERTFDSSRAARIFGYSFTIFWNVVLIIFFSFFSQYIAWYHVGPDGGVTFLPLLTDAYFLWLPILVTALVITAAANVLFIIYDRYWFKEIIEIILNIIGIVVIVNLIAVMPFDFSVIPHAAAADILPVAMTVFLIVVAGGTGVGALVRFVKLIIGAAR